MTMSSPKTSLLLALFFCATRPIFADFIATGQFSSGSTGGGFGWLARISEVTGQSQILAYGPGPSFNAGGLVRDPSSETFYVAQNSSGVGTSAYIATFTLANPKPTPIPALSIDVFRIGGLAIAPQGGLLYMEALSSLFSVNPATGVVTRVADFGRIGTVTGIAFGPDGLLYGYTGINREAGTFGVGMFRYDLANGQFTVITPPGLSNQIDVNDLSFAPDGTLWGISGMFSNAFYKFDINSGRYMYGGFTRLGNPSALTFLPAAPPVPIPEPSYAAVVFITCAALILLTRLRTKLCSASKCRLVSATYL